MATILKNIVQFTGLLVGVPVSLPHRLNLNGTPIAPQLGGANASGFTITADATNVTATRTAAATSGSVNVYVEYWHTTESVTPLVPPPGKLIGLTPFFLAAGGGGGGGGSIIVEDEGGAIPGNPFTTLNFTGAGVTASDAGGGQADITIPGGGGAAPASNVLTYRPGGADVGPIVFNDWQDLYAQLVALRTAASNSGAFKIIFDNTANGGANCVIDDGGAPPATYDMDRTEWIGLYTTDPRVGIDITGDTTITNLAKITGCAVGGFGPAAPIVLDGTQTLLIEYTRLVFTDDQALLRVTNDALLYIGEDCFIETQTMRIDAVLAVHLDGERITLEEIVGGGTGSIDISINSSTARVNSNQGTSLTGGAIFRLTSAIGYFEVDPNTLLNADLATLCVVPSTNAVYRNNDGATGWTATAL